MTSQLSFRVKIALCIIFLIPLGFATKFYHGPFQFWVENFLGGVLYEIFWCLVIAFFFPNTKPIWISSIVFFCTSLLEVLQLWHPWFLEKIRSTFLGRALIGTSFTWLDFPHYIVGCLIGIEWIQILKGKNKKR